MYALRLFFVICPLLPVFASAQTVESVSFDLLPAGTRVTTQYALQGLVCVNDYAPGTSFRASPTIVGHPSADTSPNVLVNTAVSEIHSSVGVPLVLKFSPPVDGIGMRPGIRQGDVLPAQAAVLLFDCSGNMVGSNSGPVTVDFRTGFETWSEGAPASVALIDYGNSTTPEAIDSLAFQVSAASCVSTQIPDVKITSHSNNQFVASSPAYLQGDVRGGSGALDTFRINGSNVPCTPHLGESNIFYYTFEHSLAIQAGANPIAAVARDATGPTGSDNIVLHYGAPATWTINRFHMTQRGIMRSNTCDVIDPMVAGKFTIVRIDVSVRTSGGAPSFAEFFEMSLFRRTGGTDLLVNTFTGTPYSPTASWFDSPSQMAAIHFWVDGHHVATPGEYSMLFQPYAGGTLLAPQRPPPCPSTHFPFAETQPLRLFFCSTEAPMFAPALGQAYLRQVQATLDFTRRAFPIADDDLHYVVSAPAPMSDGSASYTNLSYVNGTGYAWSFKVTDPRGLWRSDHSEVTNSAGTGIGGRIASTNQVKLPASAFGLFRSCPSARHDRRYAAPMDDNYNGTFTDDWGNYVVEFYDSQTSDWLTDLTRFDLGETFRSFRDDDHNLKPSEGEPVAPAVQRWVNVDKLLTVPHAERMKAYNDALISGAKMEHAILWFPYPFLPKRDDFDYFGGGQGEKYGGATDIVTKRGAKVWVRVPRIHPSGNNGDAHVLAHELGHNWGLPDTYYSGTPTHKYQIPSWASYAYYDGVTGSLTGIMKGGNVLERLYFTDAHYQHLFDQMKVDMASASSSWSLGNGEPGFRIFGQVHPDEGVLSLSTSIVPGEDFTPPDPASSYVLVLGSGDAAMSEYGVPAVPSTVVDLGWEAGGPSPAEPMDWGSVGIDMTVPLPGEVTWAELRQEGGPVFRVERSPGVPYVEVLSPHRGEHLGAAEDVEITWAAHDPDGDPLVFSVLYAPNPSGPWQTLASGLSGSSLQWNTASARGCDEGVIRVVACDGFNTGEGISDGVFTVDGKPPAVAILSPRSGSTFLQHHSIPLRAGIRDLEQGEQGLSLSWHLRSRFDEARFFDTSGLLPPMSPGVITAEVTVVDAAANVVTDTVVFEVLADADADGVADVTEEVYGLDPSLPADAHYDLDEDRLSTFEEIRIGTMPNDPDSDGDLVPDGEEVRRGSNPLDGTDVPAPEGCADALVITDGFYLGDTTGAAAEGEATCGSSGGSPATWYEYVASADTEVSVSTCGSLFDTVVSVHTGCPATIQNEIACNDDGGEYGCGLRDAYAVFPASAGESYWIRVSGFNGASGPYSLSVGPTPPENDACSDAIVVFEDSIPFDTFGATTDGADEPYACAFSGSSQIRRDIWFRYVPSGPGLARVSTCGSLFDTKLAVYLDLGCPPASIPLACNDDACGQQSEVAFPVESGWAYLVRVGGYGEAVGEGALHIELLLVPAPRIRSFELVSPDTLYIQFEDTAGHPAATYQLWTSSDLRQPWSPDSSATIMDLGWPSFGAYPSGEPSTFGSYRILAVP